MPLHTCISCAHFGGSVKGFGFCEHPDNEGCVMNPYGSCVRWDRHRWESDVTFSNRKI